MVRILARLGDEGGGRSHDLAQQIGLGRVELEQRRQLGADLLAHRLQRLLVRQQLLQHAQQLVEQAPVLALLGDRAQQPGRQRRQLEALQLGLHPLAEEAPQAALVDRGQGLRQHPRHERGQRRAALAVGQPGRHVLGEVDLAQLALDRLGRRGNWSR